MTNGLYPQVYVRLLTGAGREKRDLPPTGNEMKFILDQKLWRDEFEPANYDKAKHY